MSFQEGNTIKRNKRYRQCALKICALTKIEVEGSLRFTMQIIFLFLEQMISKMLNNVACSQICQKVTVKNKQHE